MPARFTLNNTERIGLSDRMTMIGGRIIVDYETMFSPKNIPYIDITGDKEAIFISEIELMDAINNTEITISGNEIILEGYRSCIGTTYKYDFYSNTNLKLIEYGQKRKCGDFELIIPSPECWIFDVQKSSKKPKPIMESEVLLGVNMGIA